MFTFFLFFYIFTFIWENWYSTCPKDVLADYVFRENQRSEILIDGCKGVLVPTFHIVCPLE